MPNTKSLSILILPACVVVAATLFFSHPGVLMADPLPEGIPAVAIVLFPTGADPEPGALRSLLENTGEKYTRVPGLRRKYFISGENHGGGIYEWESMSQAKAFYDEAWYLKMTEVYGVRPEVSFFESPAIADGVNQKLHIYLPDEETQPQ